MATLAAPYITPEQYLEQERTAEYRSEYYQGSVFPMVAGNVRHGLIAVNLTTAFRNEPAARNCLVYGPDVRVHVQPVGLYTYPDVTLVCGPPSYGDDKKESLTNPILLIEVLSPSTRDYDGSGKFRLYRALSSLREYLLVAQDTPRVEHYTRQADDSWVFREIKGAESILRLQSLACELPFSAIYFKVEFDEEWPPH